MADSLFFCQKSETKYRNIKKVGIETIRVQEKIQFKT